MTTIQVVKDLDKIAMEANRLWHRCEVLKMQIIEESGIAKKIFELEGIYMPEEKK